MESEANSTRQLRPAELARAILSSDSPPRKRARDQQADAAGLELWRRIAERLLAMDPEPDALDDALTQIVAEIGDPTGPTRALALHLRDEWEAVRQRVSRQ